MGDGALSFCRDDWRSPLPPQTPRGRGEECSLPVHGEGVGENRFPRAHSRAPLQTRPAVARLGRTGILPVSVHSATAYRIGNMPGLLTIIDLNNPASTLSIRTGSPFSEESADNRSTNPEE